MLYAYRILEASMSTHFKRITVLKICSIPYLIAIIVYSAVNWTTLSQGEGWGVIAMVGAFSFGLVAMILDLALSWLIKSSTWLNAIELIIVILVLIEIYPHISAL